jgi:hypothetical protein
LWTTEAMAGKLGVSPETVRRQIRVANSLPLPIRDLVRDLSGVGNSFRELEALSGLNPPDFQRQCAEWLADHPERDVHDAVQVNTNRYVLCPTCGERIDRRTWQWNNLYGDRTIWHCRNCDLHLEYDWRNPAQVCGRCGAPREQPTPPAAPTSPSSLATAGAADPSQPFATQATQTSVAMTQNPAPLPPSSHTLGRNALDLVNRTADSLMRLDAEELGNQIRDARDPAFNTHIRRTIDQLTEWITRLEDAI